MVYVMNNTMYQDKRLHPSRNIAWELQGAQFSIKEQRPIPLASCDFPSKEQLFNQLQLDFQRGV